MTLGSKPAFPNMRVSKQWLSDGKNWEMSDARMLVGIFLIHPMQME